MFVWYSKATRESGVAIAEAMGAEHGTLPPPGYEGDVFCYGATYSTKFQWKKRKFGRIYNDPRKVGKFTNKATLKQALANRISTPVRILFVSGNEGRDAQLLSVRDEADVEQALPVAAKGTLLHAMTDIATSMDNPDLLAADGVMNQDGAFLCTNVVLGPALEGKADQLEKVAAVFDVDNDDEKLQELIDEASVPERRVLYKALKEMRAGVAGE